MSEGEGKRASRWWLAGRSGRPEYWLSVAFCMLAGVGLSFAPGLEGAGRAMTFVILFAQIRRVHDFGRPWWWALAATLSPAVVMAPLFAISTDLALLVGLAVELGAIVWIGVRRGDAGENRFGPPPRPGWRAAFARR